MFFEKNCEALCREPRNENVLNLLATVPPFPVAEDEFDEITLPFILQETQAGDYTLIVNGVPLHALNGAIKEARKLCETDCHPGIRANHIIMGLGLGYLLDETFQYSTGKIYVYEPNIALLRFVLENVDLSGILGSGRVLLAGRVQDLMVQLGARAQLGEPLDVLVLKSHAYLMSAEVSMVMERIFRLKQSKRGQSGNAMAHHIEWIRRFIGNLKYLPETLPFERLMGAHAGRPALIIGSGPSLDDVLSLLRNQGGHFLKIAVGGALRPLLAAGIRPDYAVFLDHERPRFQLENLAADTADIPFILGPFVGAATHTVPARARYRVSLENTPYFSSWMDDLTAQRSVRFPSGSSATQLASRAAVAMGCSHLVLVGQDLALRGTQHYAGNIHARFQGSTKVRLKSKEIQMNRVTTLVEVSDDQGHTLKTVPEYLVNKQELEALAEENRLSLRPRRLINASMGGALVEGFERFALSELLNWPEFRDSFCAGADGEELSGTQPSVAPETIHQAVVDLIPVCEAAIRLAERVTEELGHILEAKPQLWEHLVVRYREFRDAYSALLDETPIVQFFTKREYWLLQRQYKTDAASLGGHQQNFQTDRHYFEGCARTLQMEILPLLRAALQDSSKGEADVVFEDAMPVADDAAPVG